MAANAQEQEPLHGVGATNTTNAVKPGDGSVHQGGFVEKQVYISPEKGPAPAHAGA